MNPLGKEQSSVFETLEKGNFIAPPGGDPRDEQDIPLLKRVFRLILPGIALTCLLPALLDGMELAAFLGALLMIIGAVKLTRETDRYRVAVICAAVQAISLAFVLVAQTSVPELVGSPVYNMAYIYGTWFGPVTVVRLAAVTWKHFPKCGVPMLLLAAFVTAATVLAALFPDLFLLRMFAVLPGAVMLIWLAVLACKEP